MSKVMPVIEIGRHVAGPGPKASAKTKTLVAPECLTQPEFNALFKRTGLSVLHEMSVLCYLKPDVIICITPAHVCNWMKIDMSNTKWASAALQSANVGAELKAGCGCNFDGDKPYMSFARKGDVYKFWMDTTKQLGKNITFSDKGKARAIKALGMNQSLDNKTLFQEFREGVDVGNLAKKHGLTPIVSTPARQVEAPQYTMSVATLVSVAAAAYAAGKEQGKVETLYRAADMATEAAEEIAAQMAAEAYTKGKADMAAEMAAVRH